MIKAAIKRMDDKKYQMDDFLETSLPEETRFFENDLIEYGL
jgi:hypothetical protein